MPGPRHSTGGTPKPTPGRREYDDLVVDLSQDLDEVDGWLLSVDGVPSSYVDLSDPTHLVFEYVRWIGDVLDLAAPEGDALDTVHLGGAGCTLPRYLAHTRPRSHQVVLERSADLIDLAREAFGLRSSRLMKLRVADAREGLAALPESSYDCVIRDAFVGDKVPQHLLTAEFIAEVKRVLRPGGSYIANVADRQPLMLARAETATALEAFRHVAQIGEPSTFRGRRFGNLVLVGSDAPIDLPALRRLVAGGGAPGRVLETDDCRDFTGGAKPLRD
jgi:SAM-dependent methyltransferase